GRRGLGAGLRGRLGDRGAVGGTRPGRAARGAQMTQRYVPFAELERIRGLDADPVLRAAAFADACRINVLYMVQRAGSGHLGTSFSSIDIVSWLHLEVLEDGDRYFSSKGHDAPALYAVLAGTGRIEFELI